MRIRLQVLRHQLPPTKVLWKVDAASTTAELLTQISDFFPLEAEGWGLEDYAVHLGGYELLHFQQLGDILKDDDEVVNLSGRHQISRDGRHLVDGIAFGRPLLRAPVHAPIHIPPRKRARLDPSLQDSDLDTEEDSNEALQLADFGPPLQNTEPRPRSKAHKHVTFSPEFLQADYDDNGDRIFDDCDMEDDDEDDDFEPPSDDDLDIGQDRNMKLLEDVDQASASTSEGSSSDSDSDDDSSDSDGDSSGSDSDAPSEEPINKGSSSIEALLKFKNTAAPPPKQAPPTKQAAPSDGKQRTRARNRRRRDAKKLAWLKSKGHLPANAARQDLKKWREENEERRVSASPSDPDDESSSSESSSSSSDSDSESESESEQTETAAPPAVKKPVPMIPRQLKVKPKAKKPLTEPTSEEFNQKREALLAALQSGGIDVNNDLSTPSEDAVMSDAGPSTMSANENNTTPQPEVRRARLDLASSNRLLFNSLGVRAPKNDADRQRLQAKLAAQNTRKPITKPTAAAAPDEQPTPVEEEEGPTDMDAWKSKISLSAVECAPGSEEYYYSTPPFPFYQRWDPSQRTKKRKRGSQAFDSSKLQRTEEELENSYSEYYNDGADGDALNYGDDEDDTVGAASRSRSGSRYCTTPGGIIRCRRLTTLPSDLSTLPPMTEETILPGAIIAFTQFEVSAATNWAPAMSPVRTASIQHVSDNKSLGLQLAKRDIPGRKYDNQGRRLFDKFEMITGDEEDDDTEDGFLEVELSELIEPRLLQAAGAGEKSVDEKEKQPVPNGEQSSEMIGVAL
ncbi:unnamed protein product [Aureobasidium mustum]|uniref:DUF7357 domain-containing protein n=1 Tax=Aureobasidium mustum TaxID=2773714 RepID=A0A9N8PNJ2_9PEZI|nr:unnamed protein product [Aureobasidium mustum]